MVLRSYSTRSSTGMIGRTPAKKVDRRQRRTTREPRRTGETDRMSRESAAGVEGRQRQVAHRVKAGGGGENPRNRVDDDRRGGDVAVNAAGDSHGEIGRSLDLD